MLIRRLSVAAIALALLTIPAHAQRKQPTEAKKTENKPVVDEKAYKSALDRIPEPKEKYDPWSITKPADPTKKPK